MTGSFNLDFSVVRLSLNACVVTTWADLLGLESKMNMYRVTKVFPQHDKSDNS